jgi:RimJ/RimL family protein N-acetyltransferase
MTGRLVLRWPVVGDFGDLCELWTDERVGRFMGDYGPRDEGAVREWLMQHVEAGGGDGSHVQFVLTQQSDEAVVGWLGMGSSQDPLAEWNFGYAVRAGYRGRGYATEALRAGLEYCRGELGIGSVWGECFRDNAASARVMAGAGMVEVGPSKDGSRRFLYRAEPTEAGADDR